MAPNPQVPEPTVVRLSGYLRALTRLDAEEVERASSAVIGQRVGVHPAQVRKDLSYFGEFGRPGLGYGVADLRAHLARIMHADREQRVVVAGIGHLGSALLGYKGFAARGFRIVGAFDNDPSKIGMRIGPHLIQDIRDLPHVVRELGVAIGVLSLPADGAQQVARLMAEAGVRAILSFAPTQISVPAGIAVRNVDVTRELEVLAYYLPT